MIRGFETKEGFFIIKVDGETFYMRSHPKDMLASMKAQKHDRFLAFRKPLVQSLQNMDFNNEVDLTIEQLEDYIKSV